MHAGRKPLQANSKKFPTQSELDPRGGDHNKESSLRNHNHTSISFTTDADSLTNAPYTTRARPHCHSRLATPQHLLLGVIWGCIKSGFDFEFGMVCTKIKLCWLGLIFTSNST